MPCPDSSLGETEVHHLDRAVLGVEEIRRLDVAVDDAGRMRRLQAATGIRGGGGGLERSEDAARQPLLHRAAGEELHRQVVLAGLLPDVVDGRRVGVLQPRRRLGFGEEAIEIRGVGRELDRQQLDRDVAIERVVVAAVDDAHAAAADALVQQVLAELAALPGVLPGRALGRDGDPAPEAPTGDGAIEVDGAVGRRLRRGRRRAPCRHRALGSLRFLVLVGHDQRGGSGSSLAGPL